MIEDGGFRIVTVEFEKVLFLMGTNQIYCSKLMNNNTPRQIAVMKHQYYSENLGRKWGITFYLVFRNSTYHSPKSYPLPTILRGTIHGKYDFENNLDTVLA